MIATNHPPMRREQTEISREESDTPQLVDTRGVLDASR